MILKVEVQNLQTNYKQKCDNHSLPCRPPPQNTGLQHVKVEKNWFIFLLTTEV